MKRCYREKNTRRMLMPTRAIPFAVCLGFSSDCCPQSFVTTFKRLNNKLRESLHTNRASFATALGKSVAADLLRFADKSAHQVRSSTSVCLTTCEFESRYLHQVKLRMKNRGFFIYLKELESLGYESKYEILNAMDFGIPQKRERIFVVSCLGANNFSFNKLERKETRPLSEFLEKDVSELYTMTQPYMLKFLNKGIDNSFKGRLKVIKDFSYTISTKQIRVPNFQIIDIGNGQYWYLTERECLKLMGFDDSDIDKLEKVHPRRKNCTSSKLYKQADNSIVVDVLMAIVKDILLCQKNCNLIVFILILLCYQI